MDISAQDSLFGGLWTALLLSLLSGGHWIGAVLIGVLAMKWLFVRIALDNPGSPAFADKQAELRTGGFVDDYSKNLGDRLLKPLTQMLGDREELESARPGGWVANNFGVQPWTGGSYWKLLLLALIYPNLSLLLLWLAGYEVRIADLVLLPAAELRWRLLYVGALAGMGVSAWIYFSAMGRRQRMTGARRWLGSLVASCGWIGFLFSSFWLSGLSTPTVLDGGDSVAGAPGIASAVAAGLITVLAGTVVDEGDNAGPYSGAVIFLMPLIIFMNVLHDVMALFIVGAGLPYLAFLSLYILKDRYPEARLPSRQAALTAAALAAAVLSTLFAGVVNSAADRDLTVMLVFLFLLLPPLNAIWDWLSLGLSRGLLSSIHLGLHRGWTPLAWAVADFVLALVLLAGLIATVSAGAAAMNLLYALGGGDGLLIDLPQYFADLRQAPLAPRFWWLYVMFLSTLIPTLAHLLAVGVAGSKSLAGEWLGLPEWRRRLADTMAEDPAECLTAQLYLTFAPMLGLAVPLSFIGGLYWGLAAHGGAVGFGLLDISEWTARGLMGETLFPPDLPEPDPTLLQQSATAPPVRTRGKGVSTLYDEIR